MAKSLKYQINVIGLVLLAATQAQILHAQETPAGTDESAASRAIVPRLLQFSGALTDRAGQALKGVQGVTLLLYASAQGGVPLWMETQNVTADEQGRFTVLLGAMHREGMPLDLFTTGQARWLAVQASGFDEQPRIQLASVAYALVANSVEKTDLAVSRSRPIPAAAPPNNAERAPAFEATGTTGPSFFSDATSGPPLQVSSAVKVANLNSDLLDDRDSSYFLNASNLNAGTLAAVRGGTGLSACTDGQVLKWSGSSWLCGTDSNSGGTITAVVTAAGSGLSGGSTGGNVTLTIDPAVVPKLSLANIFTAPQTVRTGVAGAQVSQPVTSAHRKAQRASPLALDPGSTAAVSGLNLATSGITYGVFGRSDSPNGFGGAFQNTTPGGKSLSAMGSADNEIFTVLSSGNVGIGTTSPTAPLHAKTSNGYFLKFEATSPFIRSYGMGTSGGDGAFLIDDLTQNLRRLTITTGGTVGIGTPVPNPAYLADVWGRLNAFGLCINGDCKSAWPAGGGSVTQVNSGSGLTGGPITTAGTLSLDTAFTDGRYSHLGAANIFSATQTAPAFAATGGITAGTAISGASGSFTGDVNAGGAVNGASASLGALTVLGTGSAGVGTGTGLARLTVKGKASFVATGTATSDGSGNVTGTGTKFLTEVGIGDRIAIGATTVTVSNITSDTSLTVVGTLPAASGPATITPSVMRADTATFNASTLFRVTELGNVQIGTIANAQPKLLVAQGNPFTGISTTSTNEALPGITIRSTGAALADVGPMLGFSTPNGSATALVGGIRGAKENGTSGDINGYLGFYTSLTGPTFAERMRLSSAGNLGIGLTNPAFKIDAAGQINGQGLCIAGDCRTSWGAAANAVTQVNSGTGLTGGPITTTGTLSLDTAYTDGRYAQLGAANSFTGTLTLNSGILALPNTTSSSSGLITMGGSPMLHRFGSGNAFGGPGAGNFGMTGGGNTGFGSLALAANTAGGSNTALGSGSLQANTTGNWNTAVGQGSLPANTTGVQNTAVGWLALFFNTTATGNTAVGAATLSNNITGNQNTATGAGALFWNNNANNTASGYEALAMNNGSNNTAVGANALQGGTVSVTSGPSNTGSNNTAVGQGALLNNTASSNTAVGQNALNANLTGTGNTAVGQGALQNNTVGNNTAVGQNALNANTSGLNNTAAGQNALSLNTTGSQNTATGNNALQSNSTGSGNTGLGFNTLHFNTTGNRNTAIGAGALVNSLNADDNTAVGRFALNVNTSGTQNTALGSSALLSNQTGNGNTALGQGALQANLGDYNTAVGTAALLSNTSSHGNVAVGESALRLNTVATNNTAIGQAALGNTNCPADTCGENTAVGQYALNSNVSGFGNTGIGVRAGGYNSPSTGGNRNTYIGHDAGPGTPNWLTNSTAIGADALVSADNALVLGNNLVSVGIGTQAPAARLHVANGDIYVSNPGSGIILKSPDGTKCSRLSLDNSGALAISVLPSCP